MIRENSHINKSSSSGYTLIETAIVITIASSLLIATIGLIKTWMDQSTLTANQQRLNAIQQALANYETQYNRLPCPSSYIAPTGSKIFGREVSANCAGPNNPNGKDTFSVKGRSGANVIIGAVPVRDLGLPDSDRTNTYGYTYTYAITESEAAANGLNGSAGAIDVVDNTTPTPLSVLPTVGTALYVVVDHGKDGKGAFTANSKTATPGTLPAIACPTTNASGADVLNCSFETAAPAAPFQFRSAPFSKQPGKNWFDDMIVYSTGFSTPGAQVCKTVYSNQSSGGVMAGTSAGYYQHGSDSGTGYYLGCVIFTFIFNNSFTMGDTFDNAFGTSIIDPGYNYISPTADAYCPDANYNLVAGGCTQTFNSPAAFDANNHTSNAYGFDVNYGGSSTWGGSLTASYYQIVLPPLSHPALLNSGIQGWECNGSSAGNPGNIFGGTNQGMQTQAYATCCPGGD